MRDGSIHKHALCFLAILALWACTGTDTGNPFVDNGGITDETETMVSGLILDSLGAPIPNCSLWVRPQPSIIVSKALSKVSAIADSPFVEQLLVSDSKGAFTLTRLHPGNYVMLAISHTQQLGNLTRITLQSCDTSLKTEVLRLTPLVSLSIPFGSEWIGQNVRIAELGRSLTVTDDTMKIADVPSGSYTVIPTVPTDSVGSFTVQTMDTTATDTTDPSIDPSATPRTLWDSTVSSGTLTDLRDHNTYGYIRIITLFWLTENLRYASTNSTCNPNDTTVNCQDYGRFYNWNEALVSCPDGWHIPTLAEWDVLLSSAGGSTMAGGMLKSDTGWITDTITGTAGGNGANLYGLNLLPAGTSIIPTLGVSAYFWSSDTVSANESSSVYFLATQAMSSTTAMPSGIGVSVRCVRSSLTISETNNNSVPQSESITDSNHL